MSRNGIGAAKMPAVSGSGTKGRSVVYFGLTSSSGKPAQLAVSEIKNTKGGYVSVFQVPDRAALRKTLRQAGESPHAGHPTVAVVNPKVINQPDLRRTIINGYSDFVVAEDRDPNVGRLVKLLGDLARSLLLEQAQPEHAAAQGVPASEAALTDLSTRLRDNAGRLDAKKLSDLLGIRMTDLATKVCGVSKQALSQSPTSAGIQDKLQPLEDIAQLLHWCSGDEAKLRAWLKRPNRDFPQIDGKTPSPVDLILRGHAGIVARKVHNLRTGHPA